MLRTGVMIFFCAALAACGDPLGGIPRISDVELAPNDPVAQALPTDEEIAREGFFGTPAAQGQAVAALDGDAAPVASEPPRKGGFLGLLRRAVPRAQPGVVEAQGASTQLDGAQSGSEDLPAANGDASQLEDVGQWTELAALSPTDTAQEAQEPKRRGLFARLTGGDAGRAPAESDILEVEYGTQLPYGVIARSCAAKRKPMGRKVESSAGGYKLYDTNPGATGLRTFYITGFADGCPRQITAAQALLGAPSLYEQLHYGPAGQHLPVGDTDTAYEKVKGRICGARKGKPCGAKMRQLERDTFFVNTYARPKDNTQWSELLIHKGEVVATSRKSSG